MAIDSLTSVCSKGRFKMESLGRVCRSIWNYPFIVAILLFLLCLHQYLPSIFYFLLSASPIFACTAALLGALLVHGHPNTRNVSSQGKFDNATQSLETRAPEYTSWTNRESVSPRDRFAEVRKDIVEKGLNASFNDQESCNTKLNQSSRSHGSEKKSRGGFYKIQCPNQLPNYVSKRQTRLDYSRNQHKHEDDDVDHDSIEYESDTGDKSSLDALISHVILTPQETLPLLDCEEPPLSGHSHDVFPKSELQSLDSNQSSSDSDEEHDYQDKEVETENDGDEDESRKGNKQSEKTMSWTGEEKVVVELRPSEKEKSKHLESLVEKHGDKRSDERVEDEETIVASDDDEEEEESFEKGKGGIQQVTTWTEEDEKNVRNVGNSEEEKNQLLAELVAQRRSQRNFSMISERNFIDSERYRLPVHVAPIATSRVNPFDVFHSNIPDHGNDNVIPIPGSAPPMARKNHFDFSLNSPRRTHNSPCEASSRTWQMELMGNLLKPNFEQQEVGFGRYESFAPGYKNFVGDNSQQYFAEFDQRTKEAAFTEARQPFHSTSTVQKPDNLYMQPVFVPEQQSSKESPHYSESTIGSESDIESTNASIHGDGESNIEIEATSKLAENNESTVIPDHESDHSDNKRESPSKVTILTKDDDSDAHSTTNTDDQEHSINQTKEERIDDSNRDTISSSSMSSDEDGRSLKTSNDEGEKAMKSELSPKASLEVGDVRNEEINHIEPLTLSEEDKNHVEPVYDTSPGAEKTGPFSLSASEL